MDVKEHRILIPCQETWNAILMEVLLLWFMFNYLHQLGSHAGTVYRVFTLENYSTPKLMPDILCCERI